MRRNMFKFVLFVFVFVGGLGIFQMDIKATNSNENAGISSEDCSILLEQDNGYTCFKFDHDRI